MKKIFFLLFCVLFIVSCGYKEGIIQKSEKSFLKFSGNWESVTVQIDDANPFILKNTLAPDNSGRKEKVENTLYQVSPGKHTIKIYRLSNKYYILVCSIKLLMTCLNIFWIDALREFLVCSLFVPIIFIIICGNGSLNKYSLNSCCFSFTFKSNLRDFIDNSFNECVDRVNREPFVYKIHWKQSILFLF